MGQVLLKFDPDVFIERVGIDDPEDVKLIKRVVYKSVEWARMDRGSLSEEQACEIICGKLPERLHKAVRSLTAEWHRPMMPVEGMAELVKELKAAGYGIYLLSNAALGQKDYWHDIPGSEYFDGRVVSAEEGLVKPQPEIYRLICERYGLVPSECVFIDDAIQNAEGAYFCGINPIVFHMDVAELRQELNNLGVKVSL